MDELAQTIGYLVIASLATLGFFWFISKSPVLGWIIKVSYLLIWGGFVLILPLWVIFYIHIPKGHIWAALFTVVVGVMVSTPWFIWGFPAIKKYLQKKNWPTKIWLQE